MESYEEFSEDQSLLLKHFVTNTNSNIFALRNLPEVIKGALFSRYSRSGLGLRSLLLKEFIQGEDASFREIVGADAFSAGQPESQSVAVKKAQNFYDRILDGYGDDSIGELGGAHLAIENVSILAAKIIEESRIGGSFLEKSTRYIYFDKKVNDKYLFYREPILMASAYKELYIQTCDHLFETYSKLIPPMTELMEKKFPKEPDKSASAYAASLRAKVLDCLRGLLPAGTITNLGVYGNGRFWEHLLHKLRCHSLAEAQEIGKRAYEELALVIPSFVRRADAGHKNHESYSRFFESMQGQLNSLVPKKENKNVDVSKGVNLISYDEDGVYKVAAALLFCHSNESLDSLRRECKSMSAEDLAKIFDAASSSRDNRRQKSPRALELAQFVFEIVEDFGIYRDLQRHRILTEERQLLTTDYGYFTPEEILNTEMEPIYREAMERAQEAFVKISSSLPEEAQYVVPMAYNVRWYFNINLRSLQWLCELRSQPAGHPSYRRVAQEIARQVIKTQPQFEVFFKFVDYGLYELGRLGQEERKAEKNKNPT